MNKQLVYSTISSLGKHNKRLREQKSLLEEEVKNLRGFLKHLGYTEEQILKVSFFKGEAIWKTNINYYN